MVTVWGTFLPNFRDWGLMHISRLQPRAKREPEIALFHRLQYGKPGEGLVSFLM